MGQRLAERGGRPDLIMSSPAVRARTTAELIAAEVGYPADDILENMRLYATDANTLLSVIDELDDDLKHVFVISHNPELSDLAQRLTSGEVMAIPTCGAVELTYKTRSWSKLGEKKPEKVMFDQPKDA